ncbi:MAG: shikimate kinase [Clostridia bacterium]|nr:shikimate kinase [Clostridia bacterium]
MKDGNIVLIGMPGCGKSTCGVLLSKLVCKAFVDTDLIIQQSEGRLLQQIINESGTDYFAETEEKIISSLKLKNSVIATGGSVVCYENAMKNLAENAVIVYLKISYDGMMKRITNLNTRGILLRDGESMRDMFKHRQALYEKYAQITVDCEEEAVEKNVEKIKQAYDSINE